MFNHHNGVEHVMSFEMKSLSGACLKKYERDEVSRHFHCICGGSFIHPKSSAYHRKCFEVQPNTEGNV